jgi:hypothetical protein
MNQGAFLVREVRVVSEPPACVLIGQATSGVVAPGMLLLVPLNGAVSVTLQITSVGCWESTADLAVRLEFSDRDEAELLVSLNIEGDELVCHDASGDIAGE